MTRKCLGVPFWVWAVDTLQKRDGLTALADDVTSIVIMCLLYVVGY